MSIKDFFVKTLEGEKGAFLRVLDALAVLPRTSLDYKPDPKSKTGFELASLFGNDFGMIAKFLDTGVWDMKEETGGTYADVAAIKRATDTAIDAILAKAKGMRESDWDTMGEAWAPMTKGTFAFDLLHDLIHHRGQLSTYIRPMGGKVPSIYGPSADTN